MTTLQLSTKQDWEDAVTTFGCHQPGVRIWSASTVGTDDNARCAEVAESSQHTNNPGDVHSSRPSDVQAAIPGPVAAVSVSPSGLDWTGPTASQLSSLLTHTAFSSMVELYLENCSEMTSLPPCVSELSSLEKLIICSCDNLTHLPAGMGQLHHLQELVIATCAAITSLPGDIIGRRQVKLHRVELRGCMALTALPDCTATAPQLEILDLINCSSLAAIPETLSKCQNLRSIRLTGCQQRASAVGNSILERGTNTVPSTAHKVSEVLRKLARHKSVVKLATEQSHMLETLERLSWIAVLLATATFIGFLQPPHGTEAFAAINAGNDGSDSNTQQIGSPGQSMPFLYRAFFVLDTWSFLLSLACLVTIVVLSMPRVPSEKLKQEAGHFWLLLVTAWTQLYLAVVAGCGAFVASAFTIYPLGAADIWVPTSLACAMLFLGLCSVYQRFRSLYPGMEAIWLGVIEVWQKDLPFGRVLPCGCLASCLLCHPCIQMQGSGVHSSIDVEQGTQHGIGMCSKDVSSTLSCEVLDQHDVCCAGEPIDLEAGCCERLIMLWQTKLINNNITDQ